MIAMRLLRLVCMLTRNHAFGIGTRHFIKEFVFKMARPRQFDPEITLDFAVDTFWEFGFEATSIEKLCHNLKLNPGSLYGAYGDKRTLFLAILDRYIEKVSSEAIERIAGNPSGVAGIRAYFDFLIEAIIDGKRRWGCLLTNSLVELSGREPAVAAKVELHFARLETAFASALGAIKGGGRTAIGHRPRTRALLRLRRSGAQRRGADETKPGEAAVDCPSGVALARTGPTLIAARKRRRLCVLRASGTGIKNTILP